MGLLGGIFSGLRRRTCVAIQACCWEGSRESVLGGSRGTGKRRHCLRPMRPPLNICDAAVVCCGCI